MRFLTVTFILVLGVSTAGATVINLTTLDSSGALNGGLFAQGSQQPAGTGVFDTFLKLSPGGNQTYSQGYNTDAKNKPLDDNNAQPHTRSLALSAIPLFNCAPGIPGCLAGEQYRQFKLDINQQANDPLLSLDRVIIWQLPNPDETDANAVGGQAFGAGPLFSDVPQATGEVYDSGFGNQILLSYNVVGGGSGKSDMFLYIPNEDFKNSDFVYLYSEFGVFGKNGKVDDSSSCTSTANSGWDCHGVAQDQNAGFEEWGVDAPAPTSQVPEPASIMLLGSFLLALGLWGRKQMAR